MAEGITLISSFYNLEPFLPSAMKFGAKKLILIVNPDDDTKLKENIELVKKTFGKVVEVEVIKAGPFDIQDVVEKVADAIDREHATGRKVIANITGAHKTQAIGLLFGCYARKEKVSQIVYSVVETKEFVELPLLSFNVNENKRTILKHMAAGHSIALIAKKMGNSRAFIYQQLNQMKKNGYVDFSEGQYKLTKAGRLAII